MSLCYFCVAFWLQEIIAGFPFRLLTTSLYLLLNEYRLDLHCHNNEKIILRMNSLVYKFAYTKKLIVIATITYAIKRNILIIHYLTLKKKNYFISVITEFQSLIPCNRITAFLLCKYKFLFEVTGPHLNSISYHKHLPCVSWFPSTRRVVRRIWGLSAWP